MSTEIKEIKGRKEAKFYKGEKTKYIRSTLYITRFWGEKSKGRMLQLTINNNEEHSYVQLTENQVKDLSKTLSEAFDDTIYPSE